MTPAAWWPSRSANKGLPPRAVTQSLINPIDASLVAACQIAAKRAVYAELAVIISNSPALAKWGSDASTPEQYDGISPILVGQIDFAPIIDVATREVMLRMATPPAVVPVPRRRWWQVWR